MCLDTEARLAVSIGFDNFAAAVRALLDGTAAGKGYNRTGPDGPNDLYEFVATMNDGPGHALGEIVYKARRYAARRNPEDLLKIAAWAWLIYRHHQCNRGGRTAPPAPGEARVIILADARALPLPDACVQTVITSPPYWGLRAYQTTPLVWGGLSWASI